jgi:hypothetical protein
VETDQRTVYHDFVASQNKTSQEYYKATAYKALPRGGVVLKKYRCHVLSFGPTL